MDSHKLSRSSFIKDHTSDKLARSGEEIDFKKAVLLIAKDQGESPDYIKETLLKSNEKELNDLLNLFFSRSQVSNILKTKGSRLPVRER